MLRALLTSDSLSSSLQSNRNLESLALSVSEVTLAYTRGFQRFLLALSPGAGRRW